MSGLGSVGSFSDYTLPNSNVPGHTGPITTGIAVGPSGAVAIAYESRYENTTADRLIRLSVKPDGLGTGSPVLRQSITVKMENKHSIPAQQQRRISRVPVLDWDRANNKIYMVYTDTTTWTKTRIFI